MESGYMYYLTDKNSQIERARRLHDAANGIVRTPSGSSAISSPPLSPLHPTSPTPSSRKDSLLSPFQKMEVQSTPSQQSIQDSDPNDEPTILLGGRPYLRRTPYPLPCDLTELHRQNLVTILGETVFNGPTRTLFPSGLPSKVLEVGCGSALWSSTCHDHFRCLGRDGVSFTGMDLVSSAPDLKKQGLDWSFVQHDLQRIPWPFLDGAFDYVMVKDVSMAIPQDLSLGFLGECARVLSENGTLEIRDSNLTVQCLVAQGHPPPVADSLSKVYPVSSSTICGPVQNRFLQEGNTWIEQVCDKRKINLKPCGMFPEMLANLSNVLHDVSSRRVAIPLSEPIWEVPEAKRTNKQKQKAKSRADVGLTADQAALRQTALMVLVQQIEAMGPALREVNGKTTDEWESWLANMMSNLMTENGAGDGECLELGTWWATKRKT